MGLSLSMRNDVWMDGVAVAGQDLRLQQAGSFLTGASPSGTTGIAARPGVRYGTGNPLQITAASGMNLSVNAGVAWVQGTVAANSGMYTGCLDTAGTITVATSDPVNPRIDNVCVQVIDNGNNTSTTVVTLQTGIPAPSPVAPTLPANSLLLATIAVAANATSIVTGNITDGRVYTAATGGILPMANTVAGISGAAGTYAQDLSNGRLRVSDGAGRAVQPKVGAFTAVYQQINGNVATVTTAYTTLAQVSAGCDGFTELEVFAQWASLQPAAGTAVGDYIDFGLVVDGFVNGFIFGNTVPTQIRADSTSVNLFGGGCVRNWITPANGVHTFGLIAESAGHAFTVNQPFIRVAPSLQQ